MSSSKADEEDGSYNPLGSAQLQQMMREGRSFSGHERNCAFLNLRGQNPDHDRFATISALSGLDFDEDGRAILTVDWDRDGDQDVWVTNRNAPRIRFLRNDSSNANRFIQFRLRGNGADTNVNAIGARVLLDLKARPDATESTETPPATRRLIATIHAGDGFLSQASTDAHFGLGSDFEVERVTVRWPNAENTAEVFESVEANGLYQLVQGTRRAERLEPGPVASALKPSALKVSPTESVHRIPVICPFTVPPLGYYDFKGQPVDLQVAANEATLINLWSVNCGPCLEELQQFATHTDQLRSERVRIVALCIDQLESGDEKSVQAAESMAQRLGLPFAVGMAPAGVVEQLRNWHNWLIMSERALPLPSSFLIGRDGKLRAIYKGPVHVDTLLNDSRHFAGDIDAWVEHTAALPGRAIPSEPIRTTWLNNRASIRYLVAKDLALRGNIAQAEREYLDVLQDWPDNGKVYNDLGVLMSTKQQFEQAIAYLQRAIELEPDELPMRMSLVRAWELTGDQVRARAELEQLAEVFPNNPIVCFELGTRFLRDGDVANAKSQWLRAIELNPRYLNAWTALGRVTLENKDLKSAQYYLSQAVAISNKNVTALNLLSRVHLAQGEFVAAEAHLRDSVKSNRDQSETHLLLGWALERQSRFGEARREFEEALRLDSSSAQARAALEGLLRQGQ